MRATLNTFFDNLQVADLFSEVFEMGRVIRPFSINRIFTSISRHLVSEYQISDFLHLA